MKITPKTEAEIAQENLAPPGEYDFEITEAEERTSKKGNPMIAVRLRVFVGGGERMVSDYLLESMQFKLRHFCYAIGLSAAYEDGNIIAADMVGRAGKCKLAIDDNPGFLPKNVVKDYIEAAAKDEATPVKRETVKAARPVTDDQEPPF